MEEEKVLSSNLSMMMTVKETSKCSPILARTREFSTQMKTQLSLEEVEGNFL